MSASRADFAPFLSAPQSLRTGIIPPSAATVIESDGTQTVTLLPLAGRTGVRTAEVANPFTGITYYVEYRTAAGRDLQNVYGAKTGVRVLRYNPGTGDTVLLDPSPTGKSHDPDPTLPAGKMFTSYDGAVRITTVSANNGNAVVSVAIASSLNAPAAPTAVTATAGDGSATVSWAAPTFNGGATVTGYTVTAAPGVRTAATNGATRATVTGLTNGTAYRFTVTATNRVGDSAASAASNAVTPKAAAPIFNPALDFTGDGKADVHAITSNGELYLYRGNGLGGFTGAGVRIGAGWGTFVKVLSPGDFTGDGKTDLIGAKSNGELYLYRGNGLGGLTGAGVRIGTGWGIFTKVF
jgi:hypothetical protein